MNIPQIGLGTWKAEKDKVGAAVEYAVKEAGYRHIDCAPIYENEAEIGEELAKLNRDELFVTSKLWNTDHHPDIVERACRRTLADLKLDYLDLYLMHWGISQPKPIPIQTTWRAMEKLVDRGLVKSIGVANFTTMMLVDLLTYARIKPTVNQIEIHPYNSQKELVTYCQQQGIQVTAYSPLGSWRGKQVLLNDLVIKNIAEIHGKTAAQVLIKWSLQRGLVVIPKSTTPERIAENIDVFNFELIDKQMQQINGLNKNQRIVDPIEWWGIPYFK
ncbi:MAG: hypothetical protein A2784_00630 [Candidatus Chisholmbacteria bacterium RIFCSPHIGHO2_01_FULL_48_12]|uniref:NADP-dependent oxidoreductase domain-containing protein n=1 Tax=Candidatus Chisholmbacteria bacterium RIFCSPHIGHO2_01_FULL_48_12 TaxID=1797589 RepID=A0A1G1VQB7_9BACT|nr:MAG: hypothetical protein A2784_00630 [Candidatus Chisholmbacteria bacterium RIFCSPHIGHO2_01_FULL_48_12]